MWSIKISRVNGAVGFGSCTDSVFSAKANNYHFFTFLILSQSWPRPLHVAFVKSSRFSLIYNIFLSNFMIKLKVQRKPRLVTTRLYDHKYSFDPNVKITESFYYFDDNVTATTPLRPGFYGPSVVALTVFHCILQKRFGKLPS